MTIGEMADEIDVSYWYVYRVIKQEGLLAKKNRCRSPKQEKEEDQCGYFNVNKRENWLI